MLVASGVAHGTFELVDSIAKLEDCLFEDISSASKPRRKMSISFSHFMLQGNKPSLSPGNALVDFQQLDLAILQAQYKDGEIGSWLMRKESSDWLSCK